MSKIQQLEAEMEKLASIMDNKREQCLKEGKPYNEYEDAVEYENNLYDKYSRQRRVLLEPKMKDLESWDNDMYTLSAFKSMCKSGGFIDYDGSGVYSDGIQKSDIAIYPSDIIAGNYRKDFTHVIWYNK